MPISVAETFTFTMDDDSNQILSKIAKLDTCVTVIDASNFFRHFNTADYIGDKFEVDKTDERTVTELMVDQIEFADVILVNKMDQVKDPKEVERIKDVIRKLNMHAEIIPTTRSEVSMDKIVNTGKFDFERAQQFDEWLEKDRYDIQPETEEYGISSFVYRAERPFDSVKIHNNLIEKIFMGYIYPEWLDADLHAEDEEEGHGHNHGHDHKHDHKLPAEGQEAEGTEKQNDDEETQAEEKQEEGEFEREF